MENNFFDNLLESARQIRMEWFREFNKKAVPGGTVFAGDSLIQEFPLHEIMALKGDGRLFKVHNRGIGGDTTGGLLKRLPESILDLYPAKVFLLIGTNDIAKGASGEEIAANISEILQAVRRQCPDVSLYLISLLPVNPEMDPLTVGCRTNELIRQINTELRTLAERSGARYLDFHSLLTDGQGRLKKEYSREGLHLNPPGYELLYNEAEKLL